MPGEYGTGSPSFTPSTQSRSGTTALASARIGSATGESL